MKKRDSYIVGGATKNQKCATFDVEHGPGARAKNQCLQKLILVAEAAGYLVVLFASGITCCSSTLWEKRVQDHHPGQMVSCKNGNAQVRETPRFALLIVSLHLWKS